MGDNIAPEDEMNEAGIGLGDQDTLNRLQFIERLHAIGVARYMDLPQVCQCLSDRRLNTSLKTSPTILNSS